MSDEPPQAKEVRRIDDELVLLNVMLSHQRREKDQRATRVKIDALLDRRYVLTNPPEA